MTDLEKTVVVLKRSQYGYNAYANFIAFDDEETGIVTRTVVLNRKTVDDLGWPEEITVTIEPGDKLTDNG